MEIALKSPKFINLVDKFTTKKPNIRDKGGSEFTTKKPNIQNRSGGGMSFVSTWETFQNFTTSHGISHFRHAKGYFKKSLWMFSTLGCLAALCYNIYLISLKYLNYDVTLSVNLKHANLLHFPAVTICNNNPVKRTSIGKGLQGVISSYRNELNSFLCDQNTRSLQLYENNAHDEDDDNDNKSRTMRFGFYDNGSNSSLPVTNQSNGTGFTAFHSNPACFPTSGYTEDGREQRSDYRLLAQMMEKYIALNHSDRVTKGHLLDEMVYDCVFSGGGCNLEKDFTYFFNNYHGNCYTYNSAMNGQNISKVSFKAGPRYGLSIIFNVNQKEYVGEISQSAGLRVVVHDPMRMPFPEDDAILVSPNALTHIGVNMIKVSKLNGVYGDCRSDDDRRFPETIYQKIYKLKYCEKGCHYSCLNEEIINRCSCVDIKFPLKWNNQSTLNPCSIDNEINDRCVQKVWKAYRNETLPCISNCTVPCRQITYKPVVSREKWPSLNYRMNIKNLPYYDALATDFEKFHEGSYGKVVVYLQDLTYTEISEAPFYELHEFTSDIGGVLGLYVGFSILTLVEFLELLMDMAGIFFYKLFRAVNPRDKIKDHNEENKAKIFQSATSVEIMKCQHPLLLEQKQRPTTEKIKKQITESFSLDEEDQPISDQSISDQPIDDPSINDQSISDQPVHDQSIADISVEIKEAPSRH